MEMLRVHTVGPRGRWWHPWQDIRELQREVESGFAFVPDVDVYDTGATFIVRVDLAGVRSEDLDVAIEGGLLAIKGNRIADEPKGHVVYSERRAGRFARTIELPGRIEPANITAMLNHGVLEVVVTKSQVAASRKVVVTMGERE